MCAMFSLVRWFGLLSILALAACGGTAAPASSQAAAPAKQRRQPLTPPAKVHVGANQASSGAPLFVADAKGYFKDEGLEVDIAPFANTIEMLPLLTSGQLDAGGVPPDPSTFNAIARGVELKVVGYYSTTFPGGRALVILVRQDLIDDGRYKSPRDLKGLNVGVSSTTSSSIFWLNKVMAKDGLTYKDVNLVPVPFPDMIAAFANKKLDAAVEVQPFALQIENQKLGQTIFGSGDLVPSGTANLLLVYGQNFVQKTPEAAKRYMVAILRAQRDLWHAFDKGDGDKQEMYQIMSKYTAIKDPKQNEAVAATGVFSGARPNGDMRLDGLVEVQDFFVEQGIQTRKIDPASFIDRSFVDYAVQQLGKIEG